MFTESWQITERKEIQYNQTQESVYKCQKHCKSLRRKDSSRSSINRCFTYTFVCV